MKVNDQRKQSLKILKSHLKPKGTVYTSVCCVIPSEGMSMTVKFRILQENRLVNVSDHVANVLNGRYDHAREGVDVDKFGPDTCVDMVCSLALALFGNREKLRTGQYRSDEETSCEELDGPPHYSHDYEPVTALPH